MKTILKALILLVLALVAVYIFYGTRSKDKGTPQPQEVGAIEGCYGAVLGQDVYTLTIFSHSGEEVEGLLEFDNFQKDSSKGTFQGTYTDGILFGEYSFWSEGMHSVTEVVFRKTDQGFVRGFGELNQDGTRFTDLENITYDDTYTFEPDIECSSQTDVDASDWESYTGERTGVSFFYPESFGTDYVSAVDWPPEVQLSEEALVCTEAGEESDRAGKTREALIAGETYCVTEVTEGAAGSTYTQYAFAREVGGRPLFLTFSLRYPQCANFPEPEDTICGYEQESFTPNYIMHQIFESFSRF